MPQPMRSLEEETVDAALRWYVSLTNPYEEPQCRAKLLDILRDLWEDRS